MNHLHAIWTDAALHLWGERAADSAVDGGTPERQEPSASAPWGDATGRVDDPTCTLRRWTTQPKRLGGALRTIFVSPTSKEVGHPAQADTAGVGALVSAVSHDVLRRIIGNLYDSLLVTGAVDAELTLRLPHADGEPALSFAPTLPATPDRPVPLQLLPCRVPTLMFAPADAVDLLTSVANLANESATIAASLRYWSRVAALVRELLGQQRFVPALHHAGDDRYRGFWRVVVDDEDTSRRLGILINSMPPVCRSFTAPGETVQGSALVENFLWAGVDGLVRRCLEGDELAHAIHDGPEETCSPQMRWLRCLVGEAADLTGTPEQRGAIHQAVQGWVSRLEPFPQGRACRTCFRLIAPGADDESTTEGAWSLTLHVQAVNEPGLVLDAARLLGGNGDRDPRILQRPFDNALEHLREDVTKAARHFPPLAPCAAPGGPVERRLSLEEAYAFLRDAAPILEMEGFGVWLPKWWRDDRPRLRMWLHVQPSDGASSSTATSMGLDALVSYDWRVAVGDETLSPEEIERLSTAHQPLVRLRGRWAEVHASDVEKASRFLQDRRAGRMTVFEALRQCYAADELETGLPVAGLRAHGWVRGLLDASENRESIERLAPPPDFQGELRPYQLRGLEWLSFLSRLGVGGCLADDMGLGKTIQLIALWLHERAGGRSPGPTLLVVPMSLVGNWQREIERFGPSLRVMVHHGMERLTGDAFIDEVAGHDVVISTYGLIPRDLDHLSAIDWHRIALDEAQNIKNPAAKQAAAIRSLRAVQRVALTGTPVENRLAELWSIMDFLNAGYLGSGGEFRRRFAVPIERHHDADRARRLRHLIRPFILRRLKSDPKVEVDLPEKMEMKVYCNLTREQAALYQALVDDMLGQIDRAAGMQRRGLILATLVKLKQVCNHPVHYLADGTALPHRSGKCDRLVEMLEEAVAEGDQALIFTQFRGMGELLQKLLRDSLDRTPLFLHGGTARKDRDAMVARFQTDRQGAALFILSLKAGGYGLNLTAASHVFHFDRWWNPAVEDQATDRAHRIGQDKRVQVHKFVCIGTLEERIDSLLEDKRRLADHVVGAGEEWLTELSTDRLREVFELSRDAVADE